VKNPDCPSGLVITTHMHDDFEYSSPRDYVDTKSWLAYKQNSYSTHRVRSGSCHRETYLGYDILLAITRLRDNTNIIDDWYANSTSSHYDSTSMLQAQGLRNLTTTGTTLSCSTIVSITRQYHHQYDSTYISRHDQVALVASSPAWLSDIVISMTHHLHRAAAKLPRQCHRQHDLAASLSLWLDIYIILWPSHLDSAIASMTQPLHHAAAKSPWQNNSVAPSPTWISIYITPQPSHLRSVVASMTRHLRSAIASMTQQHHHRYDSAVTSRNSLIIDINNIWL
jgi:hypothetical protein